MFCSSLCFTMDIHCRILHQKYGIKIVLLSHLRIFGGIFLKTFWYMYLHVHKLAMKMTVSKRQQQTNISLLTGVWCSCVLKGITSTRADRFHDSIKEDIFQFIQHKLQIV